MTEQHEDGDELFFDELRDNYDYCDECSGYGDDYLIDEDGELVCNCPDCPNRPGWWGE
jgi:hypothetical protein